MKKINKVSAIILSIALILGMAGQTTTFAATDPELGAASSFAVLAGSGIVSTNPPQVIIGDAGSSPTVANGLTDAEVTGTNYKANEQAVIDAKIDLAIAYADASTQPQSGADISSELASQILSPGVYHSASGEFVISGAGVLTLNGGGDPNAIFIIKAGTTLTTAIGSSVVLTNGAHASNVFWTVGTSATLEGTTFVGTIMAEASITDSGGSTVLGRLLADANNDGTGAVTLNNTEVTVPTSLTLDKIVVNNDGGTAVESDWTLTATGPTTISGPGAVGSTDVVSGGGFLAGDYTLSESVGPAGYTASSWNCVTNGGAPVAGSLITLKTGDTATCTITNNDIAPAPSPPPSATLHVVKTVINDDGGTAVASDFTIEVAGTNVSNPSFAGSETGVDVTLDAGSYSITETGLSGYLQSGSGNCSGTIAAGETKTCTITNNDIAPQLIVNKIVINDDGSVKIISDFSLFLDGNGVTSGVATATTVGLHTVSETADSGYTTVIGGDCTADGKITLALGDVKICTVTNDDIAPVVPPSSGGRSRYVPPVPPLIDVVKVPNPLVLPAGSGPVAYTYTLYNIGTVPVTNITMVDNSCSPITLVSGDINTDAKLDVDEIWKYTCSATLSATHTNIVTTTGWANGINAIDIANATVIVGVPVVPPLIHVTKVPNPLALSAGGGMVTYTNKVTNPGTVALSNVRLTDDKCGPVKYISGDTNGDSKLDTTETWVYTCQAELAKTTVNTVTANGEANGLTARDFAITTVVVAAAVPNLPDAGFIPAESVLSWPIAMISIFAILFLFHFVSRKQI